MKTIKRKAYHHHRRQKTRNRGGAKDRAVTAALSTFKTGVIGAADSFSFGQLGAFERTRANDDALSALKADVKYMLVSIENCNRLLDYMYRKKIRCVKKSAHGKGSKTKTDEVLVSRLVCNSQLESQLRDLMNELLEQLNALKRTDSELGSIIDNETERLRVVHGKRYDEIVKLTMRTPSRGREEAHATAGEEASADATPNEADAVAIQQAQIEFEHVKQAIKLARILRNEHSKLHDPPPPPLVKVTETEKMFGNVQRTRKQTTLSEYMATTLKYSRGTKCETLLNEYNTHYANETTAKSTQKSDFVHRLFGWYGIELVKAQQQPPSSDATILEFDKKGSEMNNHKELLYLFYTFLNQFDDSVLYAASGSHAGLDNNNYDVKTKAIEEIFEMLQTSGTGQDTGSVNRLLQAIVNPDVMEERLKSSELVVRNLLNRHVGVGMGMGEINRIDEMKSAVKRNLETARRNAVALKHAVVARSDMVNARANLQSTMLNLNTVYQSLLFQVVMVLNDEPHPVCLKELRLF